ncbi:succinate dehydrogenase [Desulfitibacter alkalitolerans]|uniref:succinate dehydrogenase n=1 Tax=Desulfitibacter alkalitolerans TaxID=264641 RepID=UPI0004820640|nr:succinate dehydrogenase [Desulfitibacter alkalitolerans]
MTWYQNEYFLRRLHSFSGIFPLGIFLIEHTIVNSTARYGSDVYDSTVALLQSLPMLIFLEMAFIVIPLLFHGLFGIYIVYLAKNNVLQYKYYRNWAFYLQRITAIITLIFVIYHVWALRIGHVVYGFDINYQAVSYHLADPMVFWFYVVGVVASMYHFGNGITTFLISWGITAGPHSQKYAAWLGNGIFLILTLVGLGSLLAFI